MYSAIFNVLIKILEGLSALEPNKVGGGGGTCQHLSGRQFFLLNGSILAVNLSTYNG